MIAVMPGTFNPPTFAHFAMAQCAVEQAGIVRVDWTVSKVSLGKETLALPTLQQRIEVLERVAAKHEWLSIDVTEHQLIVDVARPYDALIVGADKWAQVVDERWYADAQARDVALTELPPVVLVAPRDGAADPADASSGRIRSLDLSAHYQAMSSTRARTTDPHLMLPEAAASGYWSPGS